MISPPLSPITVCLLVAAVLLAAITPWAGVALAIGCAAFELFLAVGDGLG